MLEGQDALRAEIWQEADELLAVEPAQVALGESEVAVERLTKLKRAAAALPGRLSERASKQGAARAATKAEHEAAAAQSKAWSARHRVLAQAAAIDTGIENLLKKAAR